MQRGSVSLTLRVIPVKLRSFEELNIPAESLKKLAQQSRGLILFAGITGAGKTTTMNCFLNYLNENCPYRVITIEDPIEYYHTDNKCSIVQREVGRDTKSFASALKHVLRQDPDVVVVGEMRDLEAMQAALNAAETGHLVLSTVHTMDAVQTMGRIVDAYPAHQHDQVRQQLANTLKGIVAQRLVVAKDGKTRYPATEILIGNNMVRGQIMEGKSADIYKVMEGGAYYGMHSFDQDLVRLYREGKIDEKAVMENSTTPQDVALKLQGLSAGVEG
jgi:twitching motility protein PilT